MNEGFTYLASPFTCTGSNETPQEAIHKRAYRLYMARVAAAILVGQGVPVYSPIVHSCALLVQSKVRLGCEWDDWEAIDKAFIRASERVLVLMLPGWDRSAGVGAEIVYAKSIGKPVEYIEMETLARTAGVRV